MEFLSEGCRILTGYSSEDLVMNKRLTFNDLIVPEYREQLWQAWQNAVHTRQPVRLEYRITAADKSEKWVLEQGVPVFDKNGNIQALEGIIVDITELKQIEEQIQHLARYDNLTNLPNRALFADRIERALLSARRYGLQLAVFFIDLDKFKPINDELGHDTGDWLLQAVARRMSDCVRESDTVARLGGDEFAVILPGINRPQNAIDVAEKIRTALNAPFIMPEGATLNISCSIGVALYPEDGETERDLLRAADEAMYRAKKEGRNAVMLWKQIPEASDNAESQIISLVWKSEYLSGEPTIDREHQELFRLANLLLKYATSRQADHPSLLLHLDRLLEHVATHFENEEAILIRLGFHAVEDHKRLHIQLKEHAATLRKAAEERTISSGELIDFLAIKIVQEHLSEADRQFFSILSDPPPTVPSA